MGGASAGSESWESDCVEVLGVQLESVSSAVVSFNTIKWSTFNIVGGKGGEEWVEESVSRAGEGM